MGSTQMVIRPVGRIVWRMLAFVSIALAAIGAVLPVMPTTPFLLLAAWAAKRGAPDLYERLHAHAICGPALCDWRDQRAINGRAKILAVTTMMACAVLMWFAGTAGPILAVVALFFVSVGAFILTRPCPRRLS